MNPTPQSFASASASQDTSELEVENCEALIVCLAGRRFVIVRPDERPILHAVEPARTNLRELQPGDDVLYRGHLTTIKAIDVYC